MDFQAEVKFEKTRDAQFCLKPTLKRNQAQITLGRSLLENYQLHGILKSQRL